MACVFCHISSLAEYEIVDTMFTPNINILFSTTGNFHQKCVGTA